MANAEIDRVVQVFVPIESSPNVLNLEGDSQHSTASNSPSKAPQFSEEGGDIHDKDSVYDNPTEFPGALVDSLASVKSHSSATSSSMDGVFLTAPETPTGSVDHDLMPGEPFDSSSGPYNAAEGPSSEPVQENPMASPNKRVIITTSSTVSEAAKSETSDDGPGQFSLVNRDLQAMAEQEQVVQTSPPRSSGQEESITGARLGLQSDTFPNDNPAFSQPRRRNRVVQTPRSGRRHAIPIVRPPSPGSEEPAFERYNNGLEGVPSHYIPLYGSLHGMFYDPIIKMFVGDGLPRPTPERPDGSMPCIPEGTVTNAVNAPTTSNTAVMAGVATAGSESRPAPRRKNPDDALHIQPRSFIDDFNVVPQPVEGGSHSLGDSASDDETYPAGRSPNKKLYFCRCTGEWLPNRHECNRGPLENMPEQSGLAITSRTQLPDGWVTHRVVVDPRMYPGGVMPEQTAAGPMVGGQPAKYFTPVSETGTDPRTAEAARAAALAIMQNRGASQVRAMQRGAASNNANAPVPPSSNLSLPIRFEANQPQTQVPANDSADSSVISVSSTLAVVPIIAASGLITAAAGPIITASGPVTTTRGSAIAVSDAATTTPTTPPPPTAAVPDPTSSPSKPSAATPPLPGLGRPAKKVAGQRRQGKRGRRNHR